MSTPLHLQKESLGAIGNLDVINPLKYNSIYSCDLGSKDIEGRLLSNSFIVVEPSFSFAVCLFHTEYGCELVCKPPKRGTKCIPFL
ncbi:YxiF family protein [Bacillus velezensis]|uniref:Uncharacterized protein n=1 Tax=Bacillus amyloliquefaciens (strain Y2) TaxID=1155777 RepID=I2CBX3_BACAY|nr:conserved hypothetical protein YxiK [Bacillus velezensis YAU B9601-Y2]AJE76928.1 hypothetical protein OY17_01800 [Bacillus sp. BH072]AUG37970.1 hypothetical protein CXP43_20440 [Bacillus velezensis]QDP90270.1 hypothetical protein FGF55_19255 [Bacillus amyloliquefaciens]KOC80354.1 hypothetical protein AKJ10_14330 [Bacillus velezensis]